MIYNLLQKHSGLECEEGTYTPSSTEYHPIIYFSKTHSKAPAYVMFTDTNIPSSSGSNNYYYFVYQRHDRFFGHGLYSQGTRSLTYYGEYLSSGYRQTISGGISISNYTGPQSLDNYTTSSSFSPEMGTDSLLYLEANHIYKWYAVWGEY